MGISLNSAADCRVVREALAVAQRSEGFGFEDDYREGNA